MQVLRQRPVQRASPTTPLRLYLRGERRGREIEEWTKNTAALPRRSSAELKDRRPGLYNSTPSVSVRLTRSALVPLLGSRYPVVLQRLSELRQGARRESGIYRKRGILLFKFKVRELKACIGCWFMIGIRWIFLTVLYIIVCF